MNVSLDSGLLYTTMLIALLVVFAKKSPGIFVVQDMVCIIPISWLLLN